VRRATTAQGAGESGLFKLIEMHGVNTAGDALLAVSLAGTLFFSVPVGEARGKVALYLLITMAPFVLLAPVIGPILDRLQGGRRWAIAATLLLRAVLAFVMAGAVAGDTEDGLRLYPAAFGCLVCSKAYGVARAAAVPRLLPPQVGLVRANSRVSLAGIVAAAVAGAIGAAVVALPGPEWCLRLAMLVYVGGAVLAVRLPKRVDSSVGEQVARISSAPEPDDRPRRWNVGPSVVLGLRGNAALRAFSGFLIFYFAFLLRTNPFSGLPDTAQIALVVGGAGLGGTIGTTLGAALKARSPEATIVTALAVSTVACLLGLWLFGLAAAIVVALVAGVAQSMAKLSLDALVQRDVPERVRASAFARSETLMQLSWVLGGALGLVMPANGAIGLGVAAVGLSVGCVVTGRDFVRHRKAGKRKAAPAR
jgi:MFS family permease